MNNNNLTRTCWVHLIYYPYIRPVYIDSNSTDSSIVLALNHASANPDLPLLDKELHNVKKLDDYFTNTLNSVESEIEKVIRIPIIPGNSFSSIKVNLGNWIFYLSKLQNELKSPKTITVNQLHDFWNGKRKDCNGWTIKTKDFQPHWQNILTEKDKTEFLHEIESFGKAGTIDLYNLEDIEELCYFTEDSNVIYGLQAIMSVLAPKEVKKYIYNEKYEKDPELQELKKIHEKENYYPVETYYEVFLDCKYEDQDQF